MLTNGKKKNPRWWNKHKMVVNLDNIGDWHDEEFQKRINEQDYYTNRRILISRQDPRLEVCIWCGKKFIKKHHSEKYCSEECRKDSRGQQSRNKSHKWYHRHKHELSEKQRWGLGSGSLGEHMHDDFEKEEKVIKNELKRLKIYKKRW